MTIFEEAEDIVQGARQQQYGPPERSLERISEIWSGILGVMVTPQQVGLCMIGLKLAREAHQHKRDNLVDLCGYARLLELTS